MKTLLEWIKPQVFFAPDGADGGDPPKLEDDNQDENLELDLTDETDLSELDAQSIADIMEMDDIKHDVFTEWIKNGSKEKLLFKDIKEVKSDEDKKLDDAADQQDQDEDADTKDKLPADDDAKDKSTDDSTAKDPGKTDQKADADKDKTLDVKTITVDEKYIQKQLENLKEQLKGKDPSTVEKQVANMESILNSVKGEVMSGKAFRNYVNAQTYIKTLKTPLDKDWKPDPKITQTPEYIEKATKQKQSMIADAIKDKYPDYPEDGDPDAVKDFEDSLTNREYDEYKNIMRTKAAEISDRYDRYQHLAENWEDIARDTVKSEAELFIKKLESFKIKPQDLGISQLDLDENNYNEYLYKNLLFDAKGVPNPEIFTFVDNVIPVVKPFSLYNALLNANLEQIIQLREAAARKEAYRKGIDDQPDPSLSDNQQNPGQRDEITLDDLSFDDDSMTMEQHDNLLQKAKSMVLRGSKGNRK